MNDTFNLNEVLRLVFEYLRSMWRFRWWSLILAWGIFIAGWIAVYIMPNRYEASTQVHVDADNVLKPLLKGLSVESNLMREVDVVTKALVTRPQLEKVADATDLSLRTQSPQQKELLLTSLADRIVVRPASKDFYTISFTDNDRDSALAVVNALLDAFIESTIGSNLEEADDAERTLKSQIDAYERRLIEAELRLKEFKQKNIGVMPNQGGDYYQRLQAAQAELAGIQQQIAITLEQQYVVAAQISGAKPLTAVSDGYVSRVSDNPLDVRINSLQERLDELTLQFTDQHPEVVGTRAQIERLKAQRVSELSNAATADTQDSGLELNPIYQDLKIRANDIAVELATLRAQEEASQERVDRLRELVDVVPEVEAELVRLNRDYGVVKSRYEEMLERWETLQTSRNVGASANQVQFRVVEPPFASLEPVGPPRVMFLLMCFIVAIGSGATLALLLCLWRPVYSAIEGLEVMGRPVLGSVSQAFADGGREFGRIDWSFTTSAAGLPLGLLVAILAIDRGSQYLRDFVEAIPI